MESELEDRRLQLRLHAEEILVVVREHLVVLLRGIELLLVLVYDKLQIIDFVLLLLEVFQKDLQLLRELVVVLLQSLHQFSFVSVVHQQRDLFVLFIESVHNHHVVLFELAQLVLQVFVLLLQITDLLVFLDFLLVENGHYFLVVLLEGFQVLPQLLIFLLSLLFSLRGTTSIVVLLLLLA